MLQWRPALQQKAAPVKVQSAIEQTVI